jgi:hypothetical protein
MCVKTDVKFQKFLTVALFGFECVPYTRPLNLERNLDGNENRSECAGEEKNVSSWRKSTARPSGRLHEISIK